MCFLPIYVSFALSSVWMLTQYYLQKTIRFIRSAFLSRTFNFIAKQIQFTYMLPYFLSSMCWNDACRLGALKRPSANTLRRHVHYPNACLYSTFVCILMTHSFRPYVPRSTHTHKYTHRYSNKFIFAIQGPNSTGQLLLKSLLRCSFTFSG